MKHYLSFLFFVGMFLVSSSSLHGMQKYARGTEIDTNHEINIKDIIENAKSIFRFAKDITLDLSTLIDEPLQSLKKNLEQYLNATDAELEQIKLVICAGNRIIPPANLGVKFS